MFCLFVLMLNFPVNNFFSHVRREPPLPGYYQYFFGEKCVFAQGHNTAEVGNEHPTTRSGVRDPTTRPPRSKVLHVRTIYVLSKNKKNIKFVHLKISIFTAVKK